MQAQSKDPQRHLSSNLGLPMQIIKRRLLRTFRKLAYVFCIAGLLFYCVSTIITKTRNSDSSLINETVRAYFKPLHNDLRFDIPSEHFHISFQFNMPDVKAERKDWHDYAAMAADKKRIGPGEQGKPTNNTDETLEELEAQLIKENNFNGLLSNIISVNRSLSSFKMPQCLTKRYLAELPIASIVIPCRNEFYSVLRRTLHSIINRTPKELLQEIIIVDDHSFRGYSVNELMLYTERNFPNLVKFVKLPKRMGLMNARVAGAKVATGDVIVFLDSHIECNHNWLPPLLEPIAINDRIVTAPVIDIVDSKTFEYNVWAAWRGGIDWRLSYFKLLLRTGPNIDESRPYKDAIMMGGLFAISRRFFWEIGGYDLGLDTWGSENKELSLKIWLCDGMLLVVPCSHIGHIWMVPHSNKVSDRDPLSIQRNDKRVAEVWMDEYKHYFYSQDPEFYYSLDAGNLTEQHALRERLKCKPFKWFLEFVAPDFYNEHPYDLQPDYANGTIQSVAFPNFCVDTLGGKPNSNIGLYPCAKNHTMPHTNQMWNLNIRQEIKNFFNPYCLDSYEELPNANVSIFICTREGGNQFWYFDKKHKLIVHRKNGSECLEAIEDNGQLGVVVNKCNEKNKQMFWTFGFLNDMLTTSVVL